MKFVVKGDKLYSYVAEVEPGRASCCDGECHGSGHRTWEAAQRCLIRWFDTRAKNFREAAQRCRKELYAKKAPK